MNLLVQATPKFYHLAFEFMQSAIACSSLLNLAYQAKFALTYVVTPTKKCSDVVWLSGDSAGSERANEEFNSDTAVAIARKLQEVIHFIKSVYFMHSLICGMNNWKQHG